VTAENRVVFEVPDTNTQELSVSIVAEEVLLFEHNAGEVPPEDPDAVIPDPVEVYIKAMNLGMFSGPAVEPRHSGGAIVEKKVDLAQKKQSWDLSVRGVDRGAFLILLNMLRARAPEAVSVRSRQAPQSPTRSSMLNPAVLQYPDTFRPLPFRLDWEEAVSSRDRAVQMVFVGEPDDETVDAVYAGFELWTHLLLLGAYPDEDRHPRRSGAFPSPAFMFDAYTIEQSFEEAFLCHEDAFKAVVNWAHRVHAACPIDELRIT
jgi:hypothetical protein